MFEQATTEDLTELLAPRARASLRVAFIVATALVAAPTCYMVLWSFAGTDVAGVLSLEHASVRWYSGLLTNPDWLASIQLSLVLALSTTVLSVTLATVDAYAARFAPSWTRDLTYVIAGVVLLLPAVPYAMSVRYFGDRLQLSEWWMLLCGHVALVLPLQYVLLDSARDFVSVESLWSARIMGAGHLTTLRKVFVPIITPLLVTCVAVGFFFSLDEVVVSSFVISSPNVTIPVHLWQDLAQVVTPNAAVLGSLLVIAAMMVAWLQSSRGRSFGVLRSSVVELARHYFKEFAAAAAGGILAYVVVGERAHSAMGMVGEWAVIALGVLSLTAVYSLYRLRRPLRTLLQVRDEYAPELKGAGTAYLFASIERMSNKLRALQGGATVSMSLEEVEDFSRACFERCTRRYVGTERHVPSKFEALYPSYLQWQSERWNEDGELSEAAERRTDDLRVLLCGRKSFDADAAANEESCRRFQAFHAARGYALLIVDWARAEALATRCGLPTPDVGVFSPSVVVFFDPPNGMRQHFEIAARPLSDAHLRQQMNSFFEGLVLECEELVTRNGLPVSESIGADERAGFERRLLETIRDE